MAARVAGEWIEADDGPLVIVDPAHGQKFAIAPSLPQRLADRALEAAADGMGAWKKLSPVERGGHLEAAARQLLSWRDEVIGDLIAEGGKTPAEASGEFEKSVATLRYYSGLSGALDGRSFAAQRPSTRHETRREPVGPVVAITPWNVPLASPARKVAPALLAGNPVIVKPASQTPLSAYHLVKALVSVGIPDGVVQLLTGPGSTVGAKLVEHPATAAVSFTGSTDVGRAIHSTLAGSLVRLQLELGGKNAAVVLDDADLRRASDHIVSDAFSLAGQQCTATSRVIVLSTVADELTALILKRVSEIEVGGSDEQATRAMGPLIDAPQVESVNGYVERAVSEGARVRFGGARLARPGYFFAPTVLDQVKGNMEIAREEVFGPVLSIIAVEDDRQALSVLNDTRYGLVSSVHTESLARAEAFVSRSDTGIVSINGPTSGIELSCPFGGFKESGTSTKEHGPESLDFYTRTKLVSWTS